MTMQLVEPRIEIATSVPEYFAGLDEMAAGELEAVTFQMHEPDVGVLDSLRSRIVIVALDSDYTVLPRQRIDHLTNGDYSRTIAGQPTEIVDDDGEVQPSYLKPSQAFLSLQPDAPLHFDTNLLETQRADETVVITHNFLVLGEREIELARIVGATARDILKLAQTDGDASLELLTGFDEVATTITSRQGQLIALRADGQIRSDGLVLPPVPHRFTRKVGSGLLARTMMPFAYEYSSN